LPELIEKCKKYLEQGHLLIEGKPETLTRQFLVEPLLEILGWSTDPAVAYYYVREFSGGMDRKWEDYVLLRENRPLAFMETKPLFDDKLLSPKNVNELLNYMKEFNRKNRGGHRVDWGILTNFKELHVFYVSGKEPFFSCVFTAYMEKVAALKELLSVDGMKSEGIDRFFAESSKEELGDSFLDDLKKWRLILANGLYELNKGLTINEIKEASQRILDRVIFIRMLETLGILPYNWLRNIFLRWQEGMIGLNQPFSKVLRSNFLAIEDIYDTELFLSTPYDALEIGDEFIEELVKVQGPAHPAIYKKTGFAGQQSLDDRGVYGYNFKTLTIDIMGSAYERYLAHQISVEGERVCIKEAEKLRKKEGIYYTPPYVVDYIVEKTVKPVVQAIFQEARKLIDSNRGKEALSTIQRISSIKVLDPACGSGSFLIKVFDVFAEFYEKYNSLVEESYRRQLEKNGLADAFLVSNLKIEPIGERILLDNIYGIDLDPQAVEIAKLNLWLKMLSLNPLSYKPTIGKREKKLLPSLVTNVKQGNSLFSGFEKAANIDRSKLEEVTRLRQRLHEHILGMGPLGRKTTKQQEQIKVEFGELLKKELEIRCELAAIANENMRESFRSEEAEFSGLNGPPFNWEIEFPEIFQRDNPGFDIVIGNPPHGGELTAQERDHIEQNYNTGKGYKNTAFLFLERSLSKLSKGGRLGYVIPKSLTFAQEWSKVRSFLIDDFSIHEIADISKAFKGVLLEQIIIVVSNVCRTQPAFHGSYLSSSSREGTEVNEVPFELCKEIDGFPIYVTEKSRNIHDKIKRNSIRLGNISRTFRGLPLQSELKKEKGSGDEEVLIGDDIGRYCSAVPKRYLPSTFLEKPKVDLMRKIKIISQRIVAHVIRPIDHIIIMSTLDEAGLTSVDTVENIMVEDAKYNPKTILALINSRLIGWFTYVFIYNKAVRTMDFDGYYVGKIPVAMKMGEMDDTISNLVSSILVLCRQRRILASMFRNLLANLNMSRKERLDFVFSSPRIAELHGISLSGTSRIDPNETGTIQRFYIRLEGDCLVVSADVLEQRTTLEIIKLKFENALFRDYFYMALRDYDGVRNFSKSQKLYDATVTTMIIPRFSESNLIEDNTKTIRVLMNTLEKEFEKVKHQFCGSPVPKANLAETDRKIRETDAAIDERIFQIYGLSKDEIALVESETVPLADYA
jgi:hypothetical protein